MADTKQYRKTTLEPAANAPKRFEVSIGGLMGPSYRVEGQAGVLEYTGNARGYGPSRTETVIPSERKWEIFARKLATLDVWDWKAKYGRPARGRTAWIVDIAWGERNVRSTGSAAYPVCPGEPDLFEYQSVYYGPGPEWLEWVPYAHPDRDPDWRSRDRWTSRRTGDSPGLSADLLSFPELISVRNAFPYQSAWKRLERVLHEVGAERWHKRYGDELHHITDGPDWRFSYRRGKYRVTAAGYKEFPDGWDVVEKAMVMLVRTTTDHKRHPRTRFGEFCRAVSLLVGGRPFE